MVMRDEVVGCKSSPGGITDAVGASSTRTGSAGAKKRKKNGFGGGDPKHRQGRTQDAALQAGLEEEDNGVLRTGTYSEEIWRVAHKQEHAEGLI